MPSVSLKKLKVRHYKAVEMLLRGMSRSETARKVGVSRQTMSNWCNHEPVFIEEYQRRLGEITALQSQGYSEFLRDVNAKGRHLVDTALNCLGELLIDPDANGGSRVSAAKVILERFANQPRELDTNGKKADDVDLEAALKLVQ